MTGKWRLKTRWLFHFTLVLAFVGSNKSFGRIRLFAPRKAAPSKQLSTPAQKANSHNSQNNNEIQNKPEIPREAPTIKARPIAEAHNLIRREPKKSEDIIQAPPTIKPAFGRSIEQAIQNRPKLFQRQQKETPIDPYTAIFCENPHHLVCATSMNNVAGTSYPGHIFSRGPQPAFESGKKLLSYLTDHYFDYDDANKKAVKSQLAVTQILVTNTSGPMAYSTPPRVEIPPTNWNLFSVFHELGHMIDYKSTYPLNKSEVAQILRNSSQVSNIDTLEALIKEKQAEITADKIAAKGFAFLGDPHIRKLGYEPIDSASLLKTLKSALGFLCTSQGSPEHPSGKFRINFIGADEDLRAVLGCPVPK